MSCDITLVSIPLQVDANRCASVLRAQAANRLSTLETCNLRSLKLTPSYRGL